jgi:5-formyltetrahydrofolate cyclo-ligase
MLTAMTAEDRHAASTRACSRLIGLELFKHASIVMLYMPLAHEIDTTLLAIRCFQRSKVVCVPKVEGQRRDMSVIEVSSFDDRFMEVDEHGVRTPRRGRLVVPSMIDLVVVPGLAFDTQGRRLGRGGGYYDRFITRLRRSATTVGFAFDDQIVESVPVNDHDVSVDLLVTDRRVTRTRASRSRK